MRIRVPGPRNHAAAAMVAGVALAGLAAAGCSHQPAAPRASVQACIQFGTRAIRQHVTVTSLPPACRGLTRAQVDFAVAAALHSAGVGAGGKGRQRQRVARASRFLEHLVTTVPERRSPSPVSAPPARQPSRTTFGLIALVTWLITVGLGLSMLARWIGRTRPRRARAGRPGRSPALNLAHLGLAAIGLLGWIVYLVTGVTGVAWAACALLAPVASLGIALAFLSASAGPAASTMAAQPVPAGTVRVPVTSDPPRVRRPPVLVMSAHIIAATATILFAFLTAIGTG